MPWLGHRPLLFIHRVALTAPSTSCHWSEVTQSCPTLHDPMDCSPPGSSTHGVFQARVLEWVPSPSLCSLCLNACLWPLGDLVEPPHNSYVCVCVCVFATLDNLWDLVPFPGIKPRFSAAKALSPNHWTTREFPSQSLYSQRQPRLQQIELNRFSLKKLTVLTVDPEKNS